jgi:hypothetical protein
MASKDKGTAEVINITDARLALFERENKRLIEERNNLIRQVEELQRQVKQNEYKTKRKPNKKKSR